MRAYYFKSDQIKAFIVILYEYLKSKNRIKLEELNIFKTENEANEYIISKRIDNVSQLNPNEQNIISQIENLIIDYLSGKKINLFEEIKKLNIELDIKNKFKTDFSQKVINTLLNVKPGEITTYSEIGEQINSKAFRAIGNVCKSNPIPLIIPCHRVLKKNGEIGGFMGKSDKTWETNLKKKLIQIEGYKV
ncbi:MAG: methylated-DNA--[protein]-cysteine S-methyltransferase [Promethearchaeota archaeon]